MKLGTIYYIVPDIFTERFSPRKFIGELRKGVAPAYLRRCVQGRHRPVGGVKIHYMHVLQLLEGGYDAKMLQLGKFSGNFFGYDVESVTPRDIGRRLRPQDVVVSTEFCPYDALQFEGCTRVMFVQNWINIRRQLRPEDKQKSYLDLGYDHIISCGDYNSQQVGEHMGAPATTITNGIDQSIFYPDPEIREKNRIICLPRKNPADLEKIIALVKPQFPDANFVKVDGVTQDQIAVEYRKADIFLATGYPEGLPLPPLEAMNSGAVVVGFSGQGGREYMHHRRTAMLHEDGDCEGTAESLLEVLRDENLKESLRAAALETGLTYSLAGMKKKLLAFFRSLEDQSLAAE